MCFDKRHHQTLRRLQPAGPTLVSIRLTPALVAALQRLDGVKGAGRPKPPGQSNREETPRDDAREAGRAGNRPARTGAGRARPMRE